MTYFNYHDVAVCGGSLKSENPVGVTLSPTTGPEPAPPVTAQGDLHVNTITGETLDFWLYVRLVLLLFDTTGLVNLRFFCRCCFGSFLPSKEFVTPVCSQVHQVLIVFRGTSQK